ncbi:MAG: hypothetical protein ACFFGZ_18925 [Candidatus Thorarchaeota archaeon]
MDEKTKKELEEIIGKMQCPKDFKCYKSGLKVLCKAKDIGLETYLECMEVYPQKCPFSVAFGYSYFCKCPLRVYIAKKLKK